MTTYRVLYVSFERTLDGITQTEVHQWYPDGDNAKEELQRLMKLSRDSELRISLERPDVGHDVDNL